MRARTVVAVGQTEGGAEPAAHGSGAIVLPPGRDAVLRNVVVRTIHLSPVTAIVGAAEADVLGAKGQLVSAVCRDAQAVRGAAGGGKSPAVCLCVCVCVCG